MMQRLTALLAMVFVLASMGAAIDCGGESGAHADPDSGARDGGDASFDASNSALPGADGSTGDSGDSALVQLTFPASLPLDFPAHFSALTPPALVATLPSLCGIDTGTSSRAPTVTLCPKGAPSRTYSPPNLMVVVLQNTTVLWVTTLDVTHTVKVTGTRALAIVSAGELAVEATIDVSAQGSAPGPGAVVNDGVGSGAASACDAGVGGAGGGAGFGGDGGGAVGQSGGMFYGDDAGAFLGGSSGGGACAKGGGGGGALQLSSAASLLVLPAGSLRASGGGGEGTQGSSAGGGSGGEIFLESLGAFLISTDVSANGGGGGASGGSNGSTKSGVNGQTSQVPAAGGFAGDGGANGGNGGVAAISPTDGVTDISNAALRGSGGGAVGRIWLRSRKAPTGTPSFSPGPVVLSF